MKIEWLPLEAIHPYAHNAKKHPNYQIEQIKASIQQFGNNDPIAIDENHVIIEGHGRYLALKAKFLSSNCVTYPTNKRKLTF